MQNRITRPDVHKPDLYNMTLDEGMLGWVEEGLLAKINELYDEMAAHTKCNLRSDFCEVRREWLVNNYGTLQDAALVGAYVTDCSEDLAYIHREVGSLMDLVRQARWLRRNKSERNPNEREDAKEKLEDLKEEVANGGNGNHGNGTATADTQVIPSVKDRHETAILFPPDELTSTTRSDGDGHTKTAVKPVKDVPQA